jgi:hypothetical protein
MRALMRAQQHDWEDMGQALTDLERDLFQRNASQLARELAELRDFMDGLREELQRLEDDQQQLIQESKPPLSDQAFEQLQAKQSHLDEEAQQSLDETDALLNSDRLQDLRNRQDAEMEASLAQQTRPSTTGGGNSSAGGSQSPPAGSAAGRQQTRDANTRLGQLQSHQAQQAEELRAANGSLEDAQQALEELLGQYDMRLPEEALSQLTAAQIEALTDLIRSDAMDQALAMLQRMHQMLDDGEAIFDPNQLGDSGESGDLPFGHLLPPPSSVEELLLELGELDPQVRTTILKMQPKAREELLQGLREEGPEGYRQFIRDYFRRLTRAGNREP